MMRRLSVFLVLIIGFSVNWAQAQMTVRGVTGYSKEYTDADNSRTYFAGFAGTCPAANGNTTCNSCDEGSIKPCNFTNAYPTLPLSIRISYTGTINSGQSVDVLLGTEDVTAAFVVTLEGGSTFSATTTWADLCRLADSTSPNCEKGLATQDLKFSIDAANGGTAQSVSVRIGASYVDAGTANGTGWFFQECETGTVPSGQGWCFAQTKPGDGKVYFENLVYSPGYPGSGSSEYKQVVLFYEVGNDNEGDQDIFNRITTKSNSKTIDINKTTVYEWTSNNVGGFSNGQRVCFRLANQDVTGNIKYFTPNSANTTNWCSTPTAVVGLLDGKSCFIATAAFGSTMAPEVEWFRKFRNEYLLTNTWGRKFVKFYYQNSPPLADWIAQREWARTTVRTALWPFLAFSWISVNYGLIWALLFGVASTTLLIESFILVRRRFKLRSQA